MKESEIQSAIIDYLKILENKGKLFFHRSNNNTVYDPVGKRFRSLAKGQKRGFPDIIVLFNGKCIGIEVKTDTGRQSIAQKDIEKQFKENGGEYYIVRGVEEVKNILM